MYEHFGRETAVEPFAGYRVGVFRVKKYWIARVIAEIQSIILKKNFSNCMYCVFLITNN